MTENARNTDKDLTPSECAKLDARVLLMRMLLKTHILKARNGTLCPHCGGAECEERPDGFHCKS